MAGREFVLALVLLIRFLNVSLSTAAEAAGEKNSKLLKVEYQASDLFPEGFDWDSKHARFLVGSMSHGKLVAVNDKGIVSEFVTDEDYAGGAAVLGVRVDRARNRVLAVVRGTGKPSLAAALVAYDLDSRKRVLYATDLKEHDLPGVNDVAVDDDGNSYVTDSVHNSVWKVTPSGDKSLLVSSLPQEPGIRELVNPAFLELANGSHANGIVHYEGYLIISQSSSGALIRVRLSDNTVSVVSMQPEGAVLPAADGMAMRSDGSLVVVSFHTAWLLASKDSWRTASLLEELPLDKESFTTSVTASKEGRRIFTLHSFLTESNDGLHRDSFVIQEIEFPKDAYDNPLWLLAIVGIFAVLVLAWKFQMNEFNKGYTKKRV